MKPNCENCRFYTHRCQRYPEGVNTHPDHGCGEFDPKSKLDLDCGNCKNSYNGECVAGNNDRMDHFGICDLHKLELNF